MSAPAKYASTTGRNVTPVLGMGQRGEAHYDHLCGNDPKPTFPSLEALEARLKAIDDEGLAKAKNQT